MSDAQRLDTAARMGGDHSIGIGALLGSQLTNQDPASQMMMREEGEQETASLEEIEEKYGFLKELMFLSVREEYVYHPHRANWFLWTLAVNYYPSLIKHISPGLIQEQIRARIAFRCGSVHTLIGADDSLRRAYFRSFLSENLFDGVKDKDPLLPTKKLYAVAKSYFPDRINNMSLHQMGEIFEPDKKDPRVHRACWSARVKTWITNPVGEKGFSSHVPFQKSSSASAIYSAAQKGNNNRNKNFKK